MAGSTERGEVDPGEARLIERMIVFSDAIFAFAVTLLVLDLKPPAGDLSEWRLETAIRVVTFATTFMIVAVFWVGHLATTRRMVHFGWGALWVNLFFLCAIALMPFGSSLLVSQLDPNESWRIYSYIIVAASFAQTLLSIVLHSGGGRLVGGATTRDLLYRMLRGASPGLAFGAGLYAVEIGRLDLARWCWVLIFPILMIAALFAPRKPKLAKPPKAARAR
ncbi:MAG: DUF1211 domain-containing protein [Parvularculaceae bacterium]|nr:DUF1211 domain-containing protein [Parvularculaceae bacterium]